MNKGTSLVFASLLIVAPALLLTSCGADKKKASKENFSAAIKDYFAKNPKDTQVCDAFVSPIQQREVDYKTSLRQQAGYQAFEVLQSKGYLKLQDMPAVNGDDPFIRVSTTDKFIKDFGEPQENVGFFVNTPGKISVCYATLALKQVDDFTEPSDAAGMRTSQADVTLSRSLVADKPWLKDKALVDALGLNVDLEDQHVPIELVLKDSGWVVDSGI